MLQSLTSPLHPGTTAHFAIALEAEPLAERYAFSYHGNRRVRLPDFLPESSAAQLYTSLRSGTEWTLEFSRGGRIFQLDRHLLTSLPADRKLALVNAVHAEAAGCEFLYETRRTAGDATSSGEATPLEEFAAFVNSEPFLTFVRRLTGHTDIEHADVQATRYRPGHFLRQHDDSGERTRRAVYVLNLTSCWQPDWGGLLQFVSPEGDLQESRLPDFNTLDVFDIPQAHAVSLVAPYALSHRYSIAGWLRSS
jgi:hypothetical protein